MKLLWGYSDFSDLLDNNNPIKNGIIVDTNVLISATYDFDPFFDETTELLDIIISNQIPLFCNVNVRAEFLEIHRRIIFTEALLSFEDITKKSSCNLWFSFCKDFINNQLTNIWIEVVEKIGLNFLSLRQNDQDNYIVTPPDWNKTMELMSREGISSADAMILNMYQSSKFNAILSSDADIGFAVTNMNRPDKICVLPDDIVKFIKIA